MSPPAGAATQARRDRAAPAVGAAARGLLARYARLIGQSAWRAVREMYDNEALTHAASIAYYALLSLFPFLLLVLSILGTLTSAAEDRDAVVRYLFRYFPRQFDFIAMQVDAFRAQKVELGVSGLLALTWAALGVFNAVSSAVNYAWGVERRRSFLKHRLVSFVMMLSSAAIFGMALLMLSAAHLRETMWLWQMIERSRWLPTFLWFQTVAARYAATGLLVCCVALVFYFVPNTRVRFRDVWPGAVVTGLLWELALSGFSWYARDLASWNLVHGSIAAVVVFLLWIYISAVVLLFGVEMTAAYVRLQAAERTTRGTQAAAPA